MADEEDQVLHLVRRTSVDDFGAFFNSLFHNIDVSDDYVLPSESRGRLQMVTAL